MRVLVGCEHTGVVRRAFRRRGHEAWSCDLLEAEDGGEHLRMDVFEALERGPWDLFIAHPDCTFLTSAGLHWNKRRPGREEKTAAAIDFAVRLWRARVRRKVLENPIGRLGPVFLELFGIRPQIIQPHQFGDDASKATCLFLDGVPPLRRTGYAAPRRVGGEGVDLLGEPLGIPRWANQTDSGQNKLPPSDDRWKLRAATYPGLADAMAEQWGALCA